MEFEGKKVTGTYESLLFKECQKLQNELAQLKSKVTYRVYEENMALVDEIVRLKEELNSLKGVRK